MHAYVEKYFPDGLMARLSFSKNFYYNIGGQCVSIAEIEHAILRAQSNKPNFFGIMISFL